MTSKLIVIICALFFLLALLVSQPTNAYTSIEDSNINNSINSSQTIINIYFFTKLGCSHCVAVKPIVQEICSTCGVSLHELDIYYNQSNLDLLYDFAKRYCISEDQIIVPVIFAGKNVLVGNKEINKNLKYILIGALQENINPLTYQKQCNFSYNHTLDQTLTWATVIFASAFDSINPCAIGVLLIFLGFLAVSKTFSTRKILIYGLIYISSIYMAYLAAGLGLLQLLRGLDSSYLVLFRVAVIFILIIAAILEFKDVFVILTKKGKPMSVISDKFKPLLQKWMKKGTLFTTVVLGCLVSLFELPCTGQIYLGILAKLSSSDMHQGLLYLVVYNFIFVLPLLAILLLFLLGKTTLEKLTTAKSGFSWWFHYFAGCVILGLAVFLTNDVINIISYKQTIFVPISFMSFFGEISVQEMYFLIALFLVVAFVVVVLTRQTITKYIKVCALCFALIIIILVLSVLFLLGVEISSVLLAGLLGMLCTGVWYELKKLNFRFFGIFTIFWIFVIVALSYALFAKISLAYLLLIIVVFAGIGIVQFKDQEARALKKENLENKNILKKTDLKKEKNKIDNKSSKTKIGNLLDHCCD